MCRARLALRGQRWLQSGGNSAGDRPSMGVKTVEHPQSTVFYKLLARVHKVNGVTYLMSLSSSVTLGFPINKYPGTNQ